MEDAGSIDVLVRRTDVIVSVCPPASAMAVARAVSSAGFEGVYADVNAVSPATAREIHKLFEHFVDGGVVGPPVQKPGDTRLYLSGDAAAQVAKLWAGSPLETRVIDGGPGAASAVKVCFAAWTKASAALLLAIRALAQAENVDDALLAEWATSMPDLANQSQRSAATNAPKAWRFSGELDEIAQSFAAHGLPDGFGRAASDVYERLSRFKNASDVTLPEVVDALRHPGENAEGLVLPTPPA
ncbi:MAG: hypothetical protein QOE09_512 [Ilumatobacteraceae bacterium]